MRRSIALLAATFILLLATAGRGQRASSVRDTMRRAVPVIRQCFERALRSGEDPHGPFTIEVHVARSGHVRHAHFHAADGASPMFTRCASRALKRLRFPPSESAFVVRYPLNVDAAD